MLKSVLLFFAVALLAVACLPLQGRGAQQTGAALTPPQTVTPAPAAAPKNPVKPTPESQAKAKSLYQIDCAMCHGDNGNGKTDLATSMGLTLDDWTNPATLGNKQDWETVQRHSRRQGQNASRDGRPCLRHHGLEPRHLHSQLFQRTISGARRSSSVASRLGDSVTT